MAAATKEARAGRTDWKNWNPKERGTLCFVLREGRILLIEKRKFIFITRLKDIYP